MQDSAFEQILNQIASASHIAPSRLRERMQTAMESALENPDPAVQAMWNSIPRQGDKPTLDEFMNYLIEKNQLLP